MFLLLPLAIKIAAKLISHCLFERIVKVVEYLEDNHGGLYSKLVKIDTN
jgi:hypothetical protein